MRIDELLERFEGVKQIGKGQYSAKCPAHDDHKASLAVGQCESGNLMVWCHAGCESPSVLAAVGLKWRDLINNDDVNVLEIGRQASNPRPNGKVSSKASTGNAKADPKPKDNGNFKIVAEYSYFDESETLLFQICRTADKDFPQRRPNGKGGWDWGTKGVRKVLFRLPQLLAKRNELVLILEGEKDVLTAEKLGYLATCNPGGAGKWLPEYAGVLAGREVVIVPDNDEPGEKHAIQVANSLLDKAKSVKILRLPGLREKGDLSDWVAAGGTAETLQKLIDDCLTWSPEAVPWGEIESFDSCNVPDFPADVLPEPLRAWVKDEATQTQTPLDLAGMLALATCAGAVAGKMMVDVGWKEPLNIFTAISLEPGERKSAVFADALRPLQEIEWEEIERIRPMFVEMEASRAVVQKRFLKAQESAAKCTDSAEMPGLLAQVKELAQELDALPKISLPQLLADDCTMEAVGQLLADNDERLMIASPEGGIFDLMRGMYGKSGEAMIDVLLKSHAGDAVTTNRMSREKVCLRNPATTLALAIQPTVVRGLVSHPNFRGRGLVGRFLYAIPQSIMGRRLVKPPTMPAHVVENYRQLIRALFTIEPLRDERGKIKPRMICISAEADFALTEFRTQVEPQLGRGGEMSFMRDWASKLPGAVVRLAGIIHCIRCVSAGQCEPWKVAIAGQTMQAAVTLGSYFIPHCRAALDLMGGADDSDAQDVWGWILKQKRATFSRRDLHQSFKGRAKYRQAEALDEPLAELVRRNLIRPLADQKHDGAGRPPGPSYEINPQALADSTGQHAHVSDILDGDDFEEGEL